MIPIFVKQKSLYFGIFHEIWHRYISSFFGFIIIVMLDFFLKKFELDYIIKLKVVEIKKSWGLEN